MDKSIYLGMSGASLAFEAQAIHANNLANANTFSFKADRPVYAKVEPKGSNEDNLSVFAISEKTSTNFEPGTIITTDRELDAAVKDQGWFVVQAPDGSERLSRDGNFSISNAGVLVNSRGYPVIGNGGPIAIPPADKIQFAGDGSISIRGQGQPATTLVLLDRLKLVNPDQKTLMKDENGLFYSINEEDFVADAAVEIVPESLETSNVNPIEEFLSMMTLARHYEMDVKLMNQFKELDEQASSIMSSQ